MKFSVVPDSMTVSFQLSCLQTNSLLTKQSVTSYLMPCDDDLYGIKNITAVCPSGKETVMDYTSVLIIQSGFSH